MPDWAGVDPEKWAKEAINKVEQVPQMIAEEMANSMAWTVKSGGFTPLDTGNLSRSVTIDVKPITVDNPGYNSPVRQDYGAAIKSIKGDGSSYVAYRANYARRVNYGFVGQDSLGRTYNQSGRAFLEANIRRFPAVVSKVANRLMNED